MKRRAFLLAFAVFASSLFIGLEIDPAFAVPVTSLVYTTDETTGTGWGGMQPHTFYMQGRYWQFFGRADDTLWVYKHSTDGVTWSGEVTLTNSVTPGLQDSSLTLWYNATSNHLSYALAMGNGDTNHWYYRNGHPAADGTISWTAAETQIVSAMWGWYYPELAEDSSGYAYVGLGGFTGAVTGTCYLWRNNNNDGTWATAAGYPIQINATVGQWAKATPIALTNQKMLVLVTHNYTQHGSRLSTDAGATWGSYERFGYEDMDHWFNGGAYSTITEGDDVFNVGLELVNSTWVWNHWWLKYDYGVGWGSVNRFGATASDPTRTFIQNAAIITKIEANSYLLWFVNEVDGDLYYRRLYNEILDSQDNLGLDANIGTPMQVGLGSWRYAYNISGTLTVTLDWLDDIGGGSYEIWHGIFEDFGYQFALRGVYDESLGTRMTGDLAAVNVTAHYTDGSVSETFTVDGQYVFGSDTVPLYFLYDLDCAYRTATTEDREYWLESTETGGTFYIFDQTLTTYEINFLDLAAVLEDHQYITIKQYVNGTLMTMEKRKVDSENKIVASLLAGTKYSVVLEGSAASYTFGDLAVTATTDISLTLRGIDFPKETLLTYKYVRIYAYRMFDTPTGNITIIYQDLKLETNSVHIDLYFKNGTWVAHTTQVTDSFSYTFLTIANNTDYYVNAAIDHVTYGAYDWRQYFPRSFSTAPFGLGWMGSLAITTSTIIPIFLIVCAAGLFSQINAEVGAFMACAVAALLTYMGWISIAPGALITAFFLAVGMALTYAKRRVQVG